MSTQGDETVPVVFRTYHVEGDVIALFPTLDAGNYSVTCYQHIGQHGAADWQRVISDTRLATADEYASLARELEGIGYRLSIRKRRPGRLDKP